ncbi:glycosyltransferase family 2 protein [uncultured Robinsoniella sp.]|uniref:glycosyltransferase family 2 protein n=1 Tax=uncultured Robinsoniella sp. TaxID=904190 RepID=UPI00374E71D4
MINDNVAIIILNYCSAKDTIRLINSIEKYEENYHIIVIDNDSIKKDKEILSILDKQYEVIYLEENTGYAAGNNVGIRRAMELGYENFLIANSDTEIIYPNTIKKLLDKMKELNASIIGPKMLDASGKLDSGIIIDSKWGRTYRETPEKICCCRSLIGAFLLISKKTIEVNGLLPEEYFLYREETDYFVQAYDKGLKIIYNPEIAIIHRHGTTTGSVWDYYFNRNTIYFAKKVRKTNILSLGIYHFCKSCYLTLRILCGCDNKKNRKKAIYLMWYGYFDGLRGKVGKNEKVK